MPSSVWNRATTSRRVTTNAVLTGAASLLVEKGVLDPDDLERRAGGGFPLALPVRPNRDDQRSAPSAPQFRLGDRVRVLDQDRPGHTRAPGYVRGHEGVIVHVAPAFSYPDAHAHGLPRRHELTYHVEFEAETLWGDGAEPDAPVVVDLWETYLEAAP